MLFEGPYQVQLGQLVLVLMASVDLVPFKPRSCNIICLL